jgi:hypothetical protein
MHMDFLFVKNARWTSTESRKRNRPLIVFDICVFPRVTAVTNTLPLASKKDSKESRWIVVVTKIEELIR